MFKKTISFILSSLVLLMSFNILAEGAIPWPEGAPNMIFDDQNLVVYDASVNSTDYGKIMDIAYWEDYILVVHRQAVVILDKANNYAVLKTWLMRDILEDQSQNSNDTYKTVWSEGCDLVGATIDDDFIYLSLSTKRGGGDYSFVNTFQNTLSNNQDIVRIFDGLLRAIDQYARFQIPAGDLIGQFHPMQMEARGDRLLFNQKNGFAILTPITTSTVGAFPVIRKIEAKHCIAKLKTIPEYSDFTDATNLSQGAIGDDYAYILMRMQKSGTDGSSKEHYKLFLFVVDISLLNATSEETYAESVHPDYDSNDPKGLLATIVSVTDMNIDYEFIRSGGMDITSTCLSDGYLYFGLWSGWGGYPKPNTFVVNVSNPQTPTMIDAGIWVKKVTSTQTDLYTVQTVNVFGPIVVTTLGNSNAIVKTILNEDKTQLVQEMYSTEVLIDSLVDFESEGKTVMVRKGNWSDTDNFTTQVSRAIANKLYLVSGDSKIIKMTYTDPTILDSTEVKDVSFSPNTMQHGTITTSVDYKIGLDQKGVTLVVARFEKTGANDLRFVDVQFKSTASNIPSGTEGNLTTDGFEISSDDANKTVLKAFVWNKLSAMMPYSGDGLPTVLGQ